MVHDFRTAKSLTPINKRLVNDCLDRTRRDASATIVKLHLEHDPWLLDHSRETLSSRNEYAIILPLAV